MLTLNTNIVDRIMNLDPKEQVKVIHFILGRLSSNVIKDCLCIALTELHEHAKKWRYSQERLNTLLQLALEQVKE